MPAYAALLRGISPLNPNMRSQKLRDAFESLGFTKVQTVISSGNVLFESAETDRKVLESMIEAALPEKLGFASTTIIRSQAELQALHDARPFGDAVHTSATYLTVTFLQTPLKTPPVITSTESGRVVLTTKSEIYIVNNTTLLGTPELMAHLEKQLGKAITTRTFKTIERILAKF